MKKQILLVCCLTLIGLASFSQTTATKDKYGYNSNDSRFNKNKSTNNNSNSRATTNSSSSTSSSPGLYERKDPPINNPQTKVQPLESGKARKAKQ